MERNIHFATIRGDTLHITATTAADDGTYMDDSELSSDRHGGFGQRRSSSISASSSGGVRPGTDRGAEDRPVIAFPAPAS